LANKDHQADRRTTGDSHQDRLMADGLIIQALIQGTNHNSNCNQVVGQDILQDQSLVEAKALVEVIKVNPSMAKDTQIGVEDLNQEALVANEMDLVGPQDSKLQLPDLMISSTDRRKQANMMMGTPRASSRGSPCEGGRKSPCRSME